VWDRELELLHAHQQRITLLLLAALARLGGFEGEEKFFWRASDSEAMEAGVEKQQKWL
jgi:hypothetical protein